MPATYRMLHTVDNHPPIVSAMMCGAMDVMDARNKPSVFREKCLPKREYLYMRWGCYNPIQIVIDHDLDKLYVAVRHGYAQWQNFMISMPIAALVPRRAHRNATYHHIIHVVTSALFNQVSQALIYPRRARVRHRNTALRGGRKNSAHHRYGCKKSKSHDYASFRTRSKIASTLLS